MKAILLLIIGLNIIAVGAASEEEHSITLKWGENSSFPPFNITAVDFSPGTVEEHPEICNNETLYNGLTNYQQKSYGCNDYVFLNVSKDGNHVMDAVLSKVNRTINGAEFTNETMYQDGDGSIKITVTDINSGYYVTTPVVSLDIIIEQNETEFDIANNLTITKIVPQEANVNPCYPFIPVALTVKNIGNFNISYISVTDNAGADFDSQPEELNSSIALRSGDIWQFPYLIKPLKPVDGAEYTLPPAMLFVGFYNKTYNLSTGNISFILRSSDIILSKGVGSDTAGNITVNLSAQNNGSRAAWVKAWDSLLSGMELVSGDMNFSTVMQPGDFYNQSYTLRLNNISGNISLPPANFTYDEYRTCYDTVGNMKATGFGISNPVQINTGIIPTETALENNGDGTAPAEVRSNNSGNTAKKPWCFIFCSDTSGNLKTSAETQSPASPCIDLFSYRVCFGDSPKPETGTPAPGETTTPARASNATIVISPKLQIGTFQITGILIMSIAIVFTARRLFPR